MGAQPGIAGIDFGTSNSVVALAGADGPTRFATHALLGDSTTSFRSLLFFDLEEQRPRQPVDYSAGPEGIEAYLEALGEGRLIQSFKTHLSSTRLGRTRVGPHALDLDALLRLFLERLRERGEASLGAPLTRAVFGRPVCFAGAEDEAANAHAEARLRAAAQAAGIEELHVELEPIAAAYHYEAKLDSDELAMIADFGAGTTDFCVMHIGPSRRDAAGLDSRSADVLATGGVGVAGDNLDAALIQHVVAPALGKGGHYREFGKTLAIPPSYYHKLSRWHQLSFLRTERTRQDLERLHQLADEPEAIEALMMIIEDNQGFHLHKSVEATKIALSQGERARFHFEHDGFEVAREVSRADFEGWIAEDVAAMVACLDQTLAKIGLTPEDIDRVFMTGGTAFVPCVRREFAARFGVDKLGHGDELSSIAAGLAACGARL
ncbi:hypothetical protein PPSIR1_20674 [Plesiocystis pacifica SIR-1]|uniref:Uncharacterized protein n=1 Tax=Plesiocystis pacifica SIR-1 TaxID=391625 RepID=A6G2B1_9BACT|nr:Hsp70 family protein [Plesiocystis pacifica]EDM80080.1 hypothetical protein PPSIR1_20674 [Plesiocystis pacifica SIR-1]